MPTSIEDLELWMQVPQENEGLEFKSARTGFDGDKLMDYCVGIGNDGGGKLILGVTDKPPREVVGTTAISDPQGMQKKILDKLHFEVKIEVVKHRHGRVVVCHIPGRPIATPWHHEGRYLMRSGEELRAMSSDRLRLIIEEGKPDWLERYSVVGLTSQEVVDLLDTQRFFELLGIGYPSQREGVIERLTSERLIDADETGLNIRRICALLLAKRLPDFPDVSRKAPRVVVYHGGTKAITKVDLVGEKGYAVGFRGLVKYVMSQLPQNEVIEDALRRQVKLVPEIVVRELTANALIHQDFTLEGTGMIVEVYDDRVEFSNPGDPVVPVERFIDGHRSRNERLADLLRRFGICEEKSSGIDKVVMAAEFYQLPAPDFRSGFERTEAVIYGLRDFEEMDRNDRIRACYQHAALKFVMSQRMTNQSLRDRFKVPESKSAIISQIISATQEARLIRPDETAGGSRKFAKYIPFWA